METISEDLANVWYAPTSMPSGKLYVVHRGKVLSYATVAAIDRAFHARTLVVEDSNTTSSLDSLGQRIDPPQLSLLATSPGLAASPTVVR